MNKDNTNLSVSRMTMISLMAAVICVLGPLAIPIPLSPVPISFTNLAIFFAVCLLGKKSGTISYLVYLALGLIGLPVFSGFTSGFGKLAGPTGGYLIGMIFTAFIAGLSFEKYKNPVLIFFGLVLGTGLSYVFGTVWLCIVAHLSPLQGLLLGVLFYIPGDLIKIIIAVILGPLLKKRIQSAGINL